MSALCATTTFSTTNHGTPRIAATIFNAKYKFRALDLAGGGFIQKPGNLRGAVLSESFRSQYLKLYQQYPEGVHLVFWGGTFDQIL
jgi:hypothetical protein